MKLLELFTYQLRRITKKPLFFIIIAIIAISLILFLYLNSPISHEKNVKILEIDINSEITSDQIDISKMIEDIENPNYNAILFVINSPGGDLSVLRIVDAIKKSNKTIFCYIDGEATSAAYWICSLSNYIIARPDSIVGNIGAYVMVTDISGLLKKLGINISIIKSTPYKDIGGPYRPLTDFEREYLLNVTEDITKIFIDDVISHRKLKDTNISLSGLWFLAYKAKELGLIDDVGEMTDMMDYIEKYYNTSNIQIIKKSYKYKTPWYYYLFNFNSFIEKLYEEIYENTISVKILI